MSPLKVWGHSFASHFSVAFCTGQSVVSRGASETAIERETRQRKKRHNRLHKLCVSTLLWGSGTTIDTASCCCCCLVALLLLFFAINVDIRKCNIDSHTHMLCPGIIRLLYSCRTEGDYCRSVSREAFYMRPHTRLLCCCCCEVCCGCLEERG